MSANGRLVYCMNQQLRFLLKTRKFGPRFALIRDCFIKIPVQFRSSNEKSGELSIR